MADASPEARELCRAALAGAREGSGDAALETVRTRLRDAPRADREVLYLCLAALYGLRSDLAHAADALSAARAAPTALPLGERELAEALALRGLVPADVTDRRLNRALDLAVGTPLEPRAKLARGLALLSAAGGDPARSHARRDRALALLREGVPALADAWEAREVAEALDAVAEDERGGQEPTLAVRTEVALAAAAKCRELAASTDRERATACLAEGILQEVGRKPQEAERAYGALLAAPGGLPVEPVVLRLARLAERHRQPERAVRRLEEALRSPRVAAPLALYEEAARLLDEAGRPSQGDRLAERAARDPRVDDAGAIAFHRARSLLARGAEPEARALLETAAAVQGPVPSAFLARALLARLRLRSGDALGALALYATLTPGASLPTAERLDVAQALERAGQADEALAWYTTLTRPGPEPAGAPGRPSLELLRTAVARYRALRASTGRPMTHDELLSLGELLLRPDPRAARALLRQAATQPGTSTRARALLQLGRLQLENDPEVALGTLREAATHAPREVLGEALYLVARACERTGRDDEAGWHLRRAIKSPGLASPGPANLDLARYWLRHGEPVRALAALQSAAHFGDEASAPLVDSLRAAALELAGDTAAAKDLYEVAAGSDLPLVRIHANLCVACLAARTGDSVAAAARFAAATTDPGAPSGRVAALLRGRAAQHRGRHDEALRCLDDAVWPGWRELDLCLALRALSLEQLGRPEEARRARVLSVVERLASGGRSLPGEPSGLAPLFVPDLHAAGGLLVHEPAKLRPLFAELVARGREVASGPEGMGGVAQLLKLLLAADGPAPDAVYRALAATFGRMERKKEAQLCLKRAELFLRCAETGAAPAAPVSSSPSALPPDPLPADPNLDDVPAQQLPSGARLFELAPLLARRGVVFAQAADANAAPAIGELELQLERAAPADRSKHLFGLGNALFDGQRYEEAAVRYTEALLDPACPQRADVRHNLGIVWNELGQFKGAAECFEEVLAAKAKHLRTSSLYHLGNALLELGRVPEAAERYRAVLAEGDPSLDLALYALINLAHCHERQGDRFEAKRCLLEALGRSQQPGWIMLRLAALDANCGDFASARGWKERARDEFMRENDIFGLRKLQELLKGL